jgi:hypothetical protein
VRRAIGLALLGLAIAGCATASPGQTQPTAGPSIDSTSVLACRPISLRAPDGRPVFLSGTWTGAADPNAVPKPSVFYLTQTNDCLAWVGLSAEDGEPLGASWIETFHGTIGSDFVITGRWDEVFGELAVGSRGAISVGIEFVPVGETYDVALRLLDSVGDAHLVKRLVREGTTR